MVRSSQFSDVGCFSNDWCIIIFKQLILKGLFLQIGGSFFEKGNRHWLRAILIKLKEFRFRKAFDTLVFLGLMITLIADAAIASLEWPNSTLLFFQSYELIPSTFWLAWAHNHHHLLLFTWCILCNWL